MTYERRTNLTERELCDLSNHIESGYALDIYFNTVSGSYECTKLLSHAQINLGDSNMVFVARVLWQLDKASLHKAKEAALDRIFRMRLEAVNNGYQ